MRAMILAAGRGTRLRPLTDHTPKPLLCVNGKPLLEYHLENFSRIGIRDIVINLGHLGEKIEQIFGDGHRFGLQIQYSYENPILETGGGIAHALPRLGQDPFIVVSADVITDFPFDKLMSHDLKKNLAHLILVDNPPHHPTGDYGIVGSDIVSNQTAPLFNFAGIGLYHPDLFKGCKTGAFRLPELFERAFLEQTITGEYYQGFWHNIGTQAQLQHVDRILSTHPSSTVPGSQPFLQNTSNTLGTSS